MKTSSILYLICVLFLSFFSELNAQKALEIKNNIQNLDFKISTLQRPVLNGNQTVKALITISPDDQKDIFLTNSTQGVVFENKPFMYLIKKSQLWWLVQDYRHQAFALVSVIDGTKWLYVKDDQTENSISLETNDKQQNDYVDDNYFFEFIMPYTTLDAKHYIIQSKAFQNQYWKLFDGHLNLEYLNTDDSEPFVFEFKTFGSFADQYIPIPTYSSAYHDIELTEPNFLGEQSTKISVKNDVASIEDNTAIIGSGNITVLKKGGSDEMFQVIFEDDAIAKIGLLDYNVSKYKKEALQLPGSRELFSGIEMNEDGEIYLFNKGIQKYTTFIKNEAITLGYTNGTLVVKQGDKTYTLTGVPTPALLNNDNGNFSRLLTIAKKGSLKIAYKPETIIISGEDFGTLDVPSQHSTDPQFSYAPSQKPSNHFNWRQRIYPIAFENQGTPTTIYPLSPFYTTSDPDLSPIASKASPSGTYLGGEDFSSIDGWELIQMDFGFDENGVQKEDLRGEPYMVLYNRFTGTLRVFLYIHNSSIANNLRISLVDKRTPTISGEYRQPRLWSSYLQGKALDNPSIGSEAYSKSVRLYNTSESKFYYVDFTFNYDPCTCFFESNLQIKVDKVTQGNMEIVGKTLGGSIPAGADGYDQWMQNSDSYLTGVLDTPFGEQSQSLGDISLKSLNEWEETPWSNKTDLVIPGRKVPDWEYEALRMQYEGTATMAGGDFLSATGKAIKAKGEAVGAGGKFLKIASSTIKAVGEGMDAAGTAMKGSGRAMTAQAVKIRLDNLADEPDQTTTLSFPPPQPSMFFAELAAKGTLTIETPVFDNIIITTPGSKNAEYAPIEIGNGTKGAFPYYNEPLGVFNLLYTPEVGISLVRNQNGRFGANLRLKEKLYVTTNMDEVQGTEFGIFAVNYVITTYNTEGYAMNSRRTKPYIITKGQDIESLPETLDITSFIDQKELLDNITTSSGNINDLLKQWISVTLEIDYMGLSGVGESGKQNGEIVRQSYDAKLSTSYEELNASTPDLNILAKDKADTDFPDFIGSDNATWNDNYIITKNTVGFETEMKAFCEQTVPFISSRKAVADHNENTENSDDTRNDLESISDSKNELIFTAYPNPSDKEFNIEYKPLDSGEIIITVSDMSGRVILSHRDEAFNTETSKQLKINLQNLSGIFILNIQFKNGTSHTTKLIKK